MGKAENIKRARRLKAAKKKREEDAIMSSGLSPAGKTLFKRHQATGVKSIPNTSNVKYSQILADFVDPIVDEMDDINIIRGKYALAVQAWNAATLREKSEETYRLAKKEFISLMENKHELAQLFDEMVKQKQDEFLKYKFIIKDFRLTKIRGLDYDLSVVVVPLNAL